MDANKLVGTVRLAGPAGDKNLDALPWNPHPAFRGVSLRHLLTGAETGGALSAHLVRIEPGCTLEAHVHAGSLELHEVLRGAGTCRLGGREVAYEPGVCGLIPAGTEHSVRADAKENLYLLAKFAPALL